MQKNKTRMINLSDVPTFFSNDSMAVYIKCEQIDNANVWSIYSHNGEQIAYTTTREAAMLVALQNDFNAQSVH